MRQEIANQMHFGNVDISEIKIDLKSRDEIDNVAAALKFIYTSPDVREEIFKYLEETVLKNKSKHTGRPGMDLWKILVLGTMRLSCNWDYDKLQNMANNHHTIRLFLGHSDEWKWDGYKYNLQTLKDNISLFEETHLHSINAILVKAAYKHIFMKKKAQN